MMNKWMYNVFMVGFHLLFSKPVVPLLTENFSRVWSEAMPLPMKQFWCK